MFDVHKYSIMRSLQHAAAMAERKLEIVWSASHCGVIGMVFTLAHLLGRNSCVSYCRINAEKLEEEDPRTLKVSSHTVRDKFSWHKICHGTRCMAGC